MTFKNHNSEEEIEEGVEQAAEEVDNPRRHICTLSSKMIDLLVRQLQHELYNHNLYRSFANFFGRQGLQILEQYYIERAEEEKHHHNWIYQYLSDCDAPLVYPDVPCIKEKWEDNVEPFELTVNAEIETTALIHEMVEYAMETKDWATFNWLNGDDDETGRLVAEQIEEEAISRTALDIACTDATWLRKEKSIMNAYKEDYD